MMHTTLMTRQRGTALVVAMLFLAILGILGATAMTNTTLDERMAGNARDRDIALQAAEAALRDAEIDLTNTNTAFRVATVAAFPAAGSTNCVAALCAENAPMSTNITDPVKSAFYGQFTGELALDGPAQLPRYMIELLNTVPTGIVVPPPTGGLVTRNFRITARGVGKNTNTVVIVQEVLQMNL
ncbi:MAG TPA: PilX N-terminal domain-containing pilus assembly protein [Burkholderiales bacterium]|nr:PilX N-terminal domain-containing pilus assembly protein [Burkholderiales bacterium]